MEDRVRNALKGFCTKGADEEKLANFMITTSIHGKKYNKDSEKELKSIKIMVKNINDLYDTFKKINDYHNINFDIQNQIENLKMQQCKLYLQILEKEEKYVKNAISATNLVMNLIKDFYKNPDKEKFDKDKLTKVVKYLDENLALHDERNKITEQMKDNNKKIEDNMTIHNSNYDKILKWSEHLIKIDLNNEFLSLFGDPIF